MVAEGKTRMTGCHGAWMGMRNQQKSPNNNGMELIFETALTQAQVASVLDSVSAYLTAAWGITDL